MVFEASGVDEAADGVVGVSWRGLRVRMMRLMLIPVVSWRCRATARAAMTTVRCASIASRVWWKTGRALRSCLLIRKDVLHVPQLVIGGDHLTGAHQACGDER